MRPTRSVAFWLVGLGIGLWFVFAHVQLETDLSALMPPGETAKQRLLLEELRQGPLSRVILIALEGPDIGELAALSKALAAEMRRSGEFLLVSNGERIWSEEQEHVLFRYRYLLSARTHPSHFTSNALREAMQNRLTELASPLSPIVRPYIPADPTGEFVTILDNWTTWREPKKHSGVWVSKNGRRALLIAETSAPGFDLHQQRRVQNRLREMFNRLLSASKHRETIRMVFTGPAVFAVESEQTIKTETAWLSGFAILLVLLFLYATYRSPRTIILVLFPCVSGCIVAAILVNSVFGSLHAVAVGFGATLIGVTVDYPIHLLSHYDADQPAKRSLERIWPTIRLGAASTTLGFAVLLLSDFPGLSQLGLFAISGVLTAVAITRWILPELVTSVPNKPRNWTVGLQHAARPLRRLSIFLFPTAVVAGMFLAFSKTPIWETDIANLIPISQTGKDLDRSLRNELSAPDVRHLIVLEANTVQEALMRAEAVSSMLEGLVRQNIIRDYDIISRYLPSERTQLLRREALPDPVELRSRLDQALSGLPFKKEVFEPFLRDVAEAKSGKLVSLESFQSTGLDIKLRSLLFAMNDRWVVVVPLQATANGAQLIDALHKLQDERLFHLDLKEESNRIIATYRQQALKFLGLGAVLICILLWLHEPLRRMMRLLWPIATGLLFVTAMLHLLGERLSLFHLASLLLVSGIGLDYSLFFNRQCQTEVDRADTLRSLWTCVVTTVLAFGTLAFSQIPVLRAIGLTVSLGALSCYLFSWSVADDNANDLPPAHESTDFAGQVANS